MKQLTLVILPLVGDLCSLDAEGTSSTEKPGVDATATVSDSESDPSVGSSPQYADHPTGDRITIESFPYQIGRRKDVHLRLRESRVSRSHGMFVSTDGEFRYFDCDSRNGSALDGQQVHGQSDILTDGQILTIPASVPEGSNFVLRVRILITEIDQESGGSSCDSDKTQSGINRPTKVD